MVDIMFKGKGLCDKWVRGYYFTKILNHDGETKEHHYILDLLGRTWEVHEDSVSQRINNVAWDWENEDKSESIEEAWLGDVVEFYLKDHSKHIGYLDSDYGCLMIVSNTLPDGYAWVHEIEDDSYGDPVEDIDGTRYITARLIGNLYDDKEIISD